MDFRLSTEDYHQYGIHEIRFKVGIWSNIVHLMFIFEHSNADNDGKWMRKYPCHWLFKSYLSFGMDPFSPHCG